MLLALFAVAGGIWLWHMGGNQGIEPHPGQVRASERSANLRGDIKLVWERRSRSRGPTTRPGVRTRVPRPTAPAQHPPRWTGILAQAVPQPPREPENGLGRGVSLARRMRLDRQHAADRSEALPASDR